MRWTDVRDDLRALVYVRIRLVHVIITRMHTCGHADAHDLIRTSRSGGRGRRRRKYYYNVKRWKTKTNSRVRRPRSRVWSIITNTGRRRWISVVCPCRGRLRERTTPNAFRSRAMETLANRTSYRKSMVTDKRSCEHCRTSVPDVSNKSSFNWLFVLPSQKFSVVVVETRNSRYSRGFGGRSSSWKIVRRARVVLRRSSKV
jgi:hypothetical protein